MTRQPTLSAGTLIEEVDDTGAVHHYWILAVAKPSRNPADVLIDRSRQVLLEGNLATAAAVSHPGQRITWDTSAFQSAFALQP